jgi:hypothetical protein
LAQAAARDGMAIPKSAARHEFNPFTELVVETNGEPKRDSGKRKSKKSSSAK